MHGDDTELLLATLASVLEPNVPAQSELLDALVDCNGNVEAAARFLRSSTETRQVADNPRKRKQPVSGIEAWLNPHLNSRKGKHAFKDVLEGDASRERLGVPSRPQVDRMKPRSVEAGKQAEPALVESSKPCSTDKSKATKLANLKSLLRPPSPEKPTAPRNPPLTLSNPSMVAKHSPCTLHYSVLPPELACELFYTMLDAAQGWSRNKWWLFDRLVESPHRTSFFVRIDGFSLEGDPMGAWKEAAQFWYNGRKTEPPHPFLEEMEEACKYIEKVVNDELRKRVRYPLEYGGTFGEEEHMWRANVAAANCYEGAKESVGLHSDQLTYLGPYPTIASLSLGTTRVFRLREVIPSSESNERQARTFNIPLPHNSLIIMHASTQERFKHCVPPQPAIDVFRPPFPRRTHPATLPSVPESKSGYNCRINITFRFYRPDFAPSTIPRCKCGVPCILRPDMKHRIDQKRTEQANTKVIDSSSSNDSKETVPRRVDDRCHIKYWWNCYGGAQNEGKGCGVWKVMDVKAEGRGPFISDLEPLLKRY